MKPYNRVSARSLVILVAALGAGLAAATWWEMRQQAQRPPTYIEQPLVAPVFRAMPTAEGTLLELRIPVDPLQLGVTTTRICYVWRDANVASASLSCPGDDAPVNP
jgi:hypothetical protein